MVRTELTITQDGDNYNVNATHMFRAGDVPTDGEREMARGLVELVGRALTPPDTDSAAVDGEVAEEEPSPADAD